MTVSPGWGSFPDANWIIFWDVCRNWDTPVQGFRPPGHCKPRGVWSATGPWQARPSPAPLRPPSVPGTACAGRSRRRRCGTEGAGVGPQARRLHPGPGLPARSLACSRCVRADTEGWPAVPRPHHHQAGRDCGSTLWPQWALQPPASWSSNWPARREAASGCRPHGDPAPWGQCLVT